VFVPGYVTHLELHWTIPSFVPFLERLSSFSRLIRFDKRGTGMSDGVSGAPTLETRMDDVRAVMDAVGSRRAAFYGLSEGAAMSLLFAAIYPERTAALVVRRAFPRRMWAPDYPWGQTQDEYDREVKRAAIFGPREHAKEAVQTLGRFTDAEVNSFLQMLRFGASPGALVPFPDEQGDRCPAHLVGGARSYTHPARSEDTIVPTEVARYVASQIPTARVVEVPGLDTSRLAPGQRSSQTRSNGSWRRCGRPAAGRKGTLTAF
jgi:pimeloyl-ACP methyl ester carboxylesterase